MVAVALLDSHCELSGNAAAAAAAAAETAETAETARGHMCGADSRLPICMDVPPPADARHARSAGSGGRDSKYWWRTAR